MNDKLTHRQLNTIRHLIESVSIQDASRKAKVTRQTIYDWLKNDEFKAELRRQRDTMVNESLDALKSAVSKATQGLVSLLQTEKDELKRLVCKDILEFALKALELERLEKRLEGIEQVLYEKK